MYALRYWNPDTQQYNIQLEPCYVLAIKEARSIKAIFCQPVEIYERREVL